MYINLNFKYIIVYISIFGIYIYIYINILYINYFHNKI